MIYLRVTIMNISSEEIVKIYRDNIWKLHGVPRKILSDTIYIKIHKRIHKSTGDKETTINGIPSSNRWSNRKDQPGDRNIPATLCELSTGQLDGLAGCCKILVQ